MTLKRAPVWRRMVDFYAANPGEVLTIEDLATKFSVAESTIRCALKDLRRKGYAVRTTWVCWIERAGR